MNSYGVFWILNPNQLSMYGVYDHGIRMFKFNAFNFSPSLLKAGHGSNKRPVCSNELCSFGKASIEKICF